MVVTTHGGMFHVKHSRVQIPLVTLGGFKGYPAEQTTINQLHNTKTESEELKMAREKMVTRTVEGTNVTVLGVNLETKATEERTFNVSGKYTDVEKLKKVAEKVGNSDTFKVVAVEKYEAFETLYGMSEVEFMEQARVLDPKTRKAVD